MLSDLISVKGIVICKPFKADTTVRKPGELRLATGQTQKLLELQPMFHNDANSEVPVDPTVDVIVVRGSCAKSPWAEQKFTFDGVAELTDDGEPVLDGSGNPKLQDLILVPINEIVAVVSYIDDGQDQDEPLIQPALTTVV